MNPDKDPHPFPTYYGPPLPAALQPWNLRHYGLLCLWVFFQPSRLQHYLWQADPDLYRVTGGEGLWRWLRHPAYRSPMLMMPILSFTLSMSIAQLISWLEGEPINWTRVAASIMISIVTSIVFGMSGNVADSIVFGLTFGIVGMMFNMKFSLAGSVLFGIVSGVMVGSAFGIAVDVTWGAMVGVVSGMAFGMGLNVSNNVADSVVGGVAGLIGGSRLLFHLVEWPLTWVSTHYLQNRNNHWSYHAILWDEIAVWPLPDTVNLLQDILEANPANSLPFLAKVAENPFQAIFVRRVLLNWLNRHTEPLVTLYHTIWYAELDAYVSPPTAPIQFRFKPTARLVLLSQIGQSFINTSGSSNGESIERFLWRLLNRRQRRLQPTPLSRFSLLLRDLYERQTDLETDDLAAIRTDLLDPARYHDLRLLPGGVEIVHTLDIIHACLGYATIPDLVAAQTLLADLAELDTPLIRPGVVQALQALSDISAQAAIFQEATSLPRQTTALNLAAGWLAELDEYVRREVPPPERVLLIRVVGLWQDIVARAQGALGQSALRGMSRAEQRALEVSQPRSTIWERPNTPLPNPYIVGDPVYPPLLAGRVDIFNRISEIWSDKANLDSIILYGHRRMGKSSILRNLDRAAPSGSIIVYADLKGETSFVASTGDLLFALADRLYLSLQQSLPDANLPEPDPAQYATPAQAQIQFNRLTGRIAALLDGHILILALDEFEALEEAVVEGKIGVEIFQLLRTKTQEPWLTLVFGGLHTLDEMSRDYQQPFYGSYADILVSYLGYDDAWRLIANPTPDFNLDYTHDAVARIIAETGGQPYLIQQVCRDALDHLNHELFDLNQKRDVRITLADVEAVLTDDFFRRGNGYFDGVWTQTTDETQHALLRALAQRSTPWTLAELAAVCPLEPDRLLAHLRWAERHDILQKREGEPATWQFYVPLLRRWILGE